MECEVFLFCFSLYSGWVLVSRIDRSIAQKCTPAAPLETNSGADVFLWVLQNFQKNILTNNCGRLHQKKLCICTFFKEWLVKYINIFCSVYSRIPVENGNLYVILVLLCINQECWNLRKKAVLFWLVLWSEDYLKNTL